MQPVDVRKLKKIRKIYEGPREISERIKILLMFEFTPVSEITPSSPLGISIHHTVAQPVKLKPIMNFCVYENTDNWNFEIICIDRICVL